MGGLELLIAMILAGTITHAVENSGRQAKARWDQSREDARRSSQARQESRQARFDQARDRMGAAKSKGPKDPLWWPYAAAYGLAGATAAVGAGAVGAAAGARRGAQSGYRVGREGADKGWNLRDTWNRWRQQHPRKPIELEQCDHCGGWTTELHSTMYRGDVCADCIPADTYDRDDEPEPQAEPEPDVESETPRDDTVHVPDTPELIYAQAERLEIEETEQKENTVMTALPSASIGTTGEGYTDTVQSLQALAKEMQDAQQAATDLGDSLTANSLDPDTLQQIGDLVDQVEACSTLAENLHRHVEQRHNPMAEATAAAGGSQNVATKTWYDQY